MAPVRGISTSVTIGTVWSSLGSVVVYDLGMGSVVLTLTLVAAVFKAGIAARLRVLLPYVGRIGTITLLIAGAYIVYYWLTVGALLERIA
jgi:cytochrome c-type biogenesis protein